LLPFSAWGNPLVVLDSGHEPSRPGSIGVCGKEELAYNDELVAEVAEAITKAGDFKILLTRAAGKEVSVSADGAQFLKEEHRANWKENPRLYERASIANRFGAAALISVHHDSTAAKYQEPAPKACQGKDGKRLAKAFRQKGLSVGFSLFVFHGPDEARFQTSLKLAKAIGAGFLAAGRPVSTHHGEAEDCGSCELLDANLGIYHKNLAILRASDVPGVLVEAGVIVDTADEKAVNRSAFRRAAAAAISRGLRETLPRP
jgi:N-acetylmuramoyl-L-alanine amidase